MHECPEITQAREFPIQRKTLDTSSATMNKLHNDQDDANKFEPREGQRGLLCSNKAPSRCPSLGYEFILSPEKLDQAFDVLFEEVWKLTKPKNGTD